MTRSHLLCAAVILLSLSNVQAQTGTQSAPSEDVERVTEEASRVAEMPLSTVDRPLYRAAQDSKKQLSDKYGVNWALEDTLIYQAASGGIDPNDAMVNTLGLFATW